MNKHIELVKKWLDDRDSVSREERKANSADAANAADAADAADAVANYAAVGAAVQAAYWIKKYDELTGNSDEK